MLKSISTITWSVDNFDASVDALTDIPGYRVASASTVSDELATFWRAPRMAGQRCALLEPASAEPVYLRLVEACDGSMPAPFTAYGWNAAELHVTDVSSLAKRLAGRSFGL